MRNMGRYLEEFDKLKFEDIQSFYRKKKFFEIIDPLQDIKSVIEIGCGESSVFEFKQWKRNVLVEPEFEFINRLSGRTNIDNIYISNSFLENFKGNDTFDLVVVSCLLHEIPNKNNFMKAVWGIMNEGGLLYIDVPNALSIHRYLAVSSKHLDNLFSTTETSKKMQQADTVFFPQGFSDFLTTRGFIIVDIGTNFVKFFHHARMADILATGNLGKKELDAFYDMQKDFPENGSEIWCLAKKPDD